MDDEQLYTRVDELMQQGLSYWAAYDQAKAEQQAEGGKQS
jgi:hypothetical protein